MWSKKISLSIVLCMTSLSIISEEMPWNHYVQLAFDDIQTAKLMQAMDHNDMRTFSRLLVADYELANTILLDNATFDDINPIHYAAKIGNKEMMQTFLTRGIDINKKSSSGKTPLYYAIMNNQNIDFINFLLQNGANPLTVDAFGNTMLHAALKASDKYNWSTNNANIQNLVKIRERLLGEGLNPEQLNANSISASDFPELPTQTSLTTETLADEQSEDCPICQATNSDVKTNCCNQPMCKACFEQIKTNGRLNRCPFCRFPPTRNSENNQNFDITQEFTVRPLRH